jgi:CcmD family protein
MKRFNKLLFFIALAMLPAGAFAQSSPEMADLMRQDGKIYVVVAVIAIIFLVMAVYLVSLDRKMSKIEQESSKK